MFGRHIGKISFITGTANLRRFTIEKSTNKVKELYPLSLATFEKFITSESAFVDKSLLIQKLLEIKCDAFLITRPRRWGKTLNMQMLETFFQADVNNETGMPDFSKKSKKPLFANLDIANADAIKCPITGELTKNKMMEYQGSFPVINLTFKCWDEITTKEDLIGNFADSLEPAFSKHSYILKSSKNNLLPREYDIINMFLNQKPYEFTSYDIAESLKRLISALHIHYGRKVVLLVDEYDSILNDLFSKNSPLFDSAVGLFKRLFSTIKNNESLMFTVFSGITRMAKAGVFSGLNNLYQDSVIDYEFSKYFGFTEAEVNSLLGKLIELKPELSIKKEKALIAKWYNGYNIGNQTMYNPWSVMHCFNALHKGFKSPYKPYWIDTSSNALIKEAIIEVPTTDMIENLILLGQIKFNYVESFSYNDIKTKEESLLSFLIHCGYLTKFKKNIYRIPNHEVHTYFLDNVLPSLMNKRNESRNTDLLIINFENTQKFGETLQQMIATMSYENYTEYNFQTFIIVPFVKSEGKKANHTIFIEQITYNRTKIDLLFAPKEGLSKSVFIFELKKSDSLGSINTMMEDALLQVFERQYADFALKNAKLSENRHWENFHIRAIVFSPNISDTQWTIAIREFKFSKEKLQTVCKTFEKERLKIKSENKNKNKNKNKDKDKDKIKNNEINKKMKKVLIELLLSFSDSTSEYFSQPN